jgi:hypothetical protein
MYRSTIVIALMLVVTNASFAAPSKKEVPAMSEQDRAALLDAYREMQRAMLAANTTRLDALLDRDYTLTHITGYRQSKQEWLEAIKSGEMRYHAAKEKSVRVDVDGSGAVVVGRSVVDATIYGSRGTWNLQVTTKYSRVDGKWIAKSTVATTWRE